MEGGDEVEVGRQMTNRTRQILDMSASEHQEMGMFGHLAGMLGASSNKSSDVGAAEEMIKRRRKSVALSETSAIEANPVKRTNTCPSVPSNIANIIPQLNTWLRTELPSRFAECDKQLSELRKELGSRFAILEERLDGAQAHERAGTKQSSRSAFKLKSPAVSPKLNAVRKAAKKPSVPLTEMLKAIRNIDDRNIEDTESPLPPKLSIDDSDSLAEQSSDVQTEFVETHQTSMPATHKYADDRSDELPVQVPTSPVAVFLQDEWSHTIQPEEENCPVPPSGRTKRTSQSSTTSSSSSRPSRRPVPLRLRSRSRSFDETAACDRQVSGSMDSIGSFQGIRSGLDQFHQHLRRTRKRSQWAMKLWAFLDDPESYAYGHAYVQFMTIITICGVCIPVMQSLDPPPLHAQTQGIADIIFDGLLFVEVALRFYVCPNRLKFLQAMYNIVDISALVLTCFLKVTLGLSVTARQTELRGRDMFTALACLLPVLRLLRLVRRFQTFHLILKAFRMALEALPVLIYTLAVLVLFFASIIYVVEDPSNIESYSHSVWFVIVTVGTIGYGDTVPKGTLGIVTSAALIVVSALYMAMPLGIVGKAFGDVWDEKDRILLLQRTRASFVAAGYEPVDVPTMFMSFDTDGDGQLSLREFAEMMGKLELDLSQGRIAELFHAFDYNGSGYVDDREFVKALFPAAYDDIYYEDDVENEDEAQDI
eukprot:TRINITY_DN12236_c0_g1_i1.p1 TRINITY_DN12236_c0_g1~~TRINITY_DN12236_c0_g1_i1.p1  ORF type:complete len:707 (+),score=119.00 TRINITY_DN12236_c0_g1_i1:100-2220(+)